MKRASSPMPTSLDDVLIDANLLNATQLDQARRAAEHSGAPLIATLLEQELVEEDALLEALHARLSFDLFDATSAVDPEALREIPHDQANRFKLLPIDLDRTNPHDPILVVAMADPLDTQAIAEIEYATGCRVRPLIGRLSTLHDAIRTHYRHLVTQIIPRQNTATSPRRKERQPFGAQLSDQALETQPVPRIQHEATVLQRVNALVALLVRKGLFTQEDYEDQLRSIVRPYGDEKLP